MQINLPYELIKRIERNSFLCHFDGQRYIWTPIWYDLYHCYYRVGIFLFKVDKSDVTDTLLSSGAAEVTCQPAQPSK